MRLTTVVAINLGQVVQRARRGLRLTQTQLGARVGVEQAWISRIELGHGRGVPLEIWIAIGLALERPLATSFSKPLGEAREPTDAGHLAMQERLLELARATGRVATFELPTRRSDPRHSIDVCIRDGRSRVLIIQDAWNTFGDVGAAIRSTNRKVAEAADLAATIDDGPSLSRRHGLGRATDRCESLADKPLSRDFQLGLSWLVTGLGEIPAHWFAATGASGPGMARTHRRARHRMAPPHVIGACDRRPSELAG